MWQKSKNIYHLLKSLLAGVYFGFPGRGMRVVGVTGTDGKTTTASLIYQILKASGKKVALISTVSAKIGDKEYDTGFHVSTPDGWHLQSYLKKAKMAGCTHLVLEVTSHGLDQNRVFGIHFDVSVITNISREHLDYHKTMENYMKAKAKLLKMSKTAILNIDDQSYSFLNKEVQNKKVVTYGLSDSAEINPKNFSFTTTLPGLFNQYNCLAAVAVTRMLDISDQDIREAITNFEPPEGRMQTVYKKDFSIIIDFAHTPNALVGLLSALKKETKGQLIHVFGSAGERDQGKRPLMGKASATFSDQIILTAEDPRHENVEDIIKDIKQGIKSSAKVHEIVDRQDAISYAVSLAKKDDIVVITGKGHEKTMNFKGRELPWSDFEAVKTALKKVR